jgi:hypothetical protein
MAEDTAIQLPPDVLKSPEARALFGAGQPFLTQSKKIQEDIAQSKGAELQATQAQKELESKGMYEASQKAAEQTRGAVEGYKKSLEENPLPAFVPSKEDAGDLATLFTLTNILGFIVGAKGNAQNALFAMNGMLEGHQKGREDLYKKEKDEFEKNFKAVVEKHKELRNGMEDAIKLASVDKEAGLEKARYEAAKSGSAIVQEQVKQGNLVAAQKILDNSQAYVDNAVKEFVKQQDKSRELEQQKKLKEFEFNLANRKLQVLGATANGDKLIMISPTGEISTQDAPKDINLSKLIKPGEKPGKQPGAFGATAFLNSVLGGSTGNVKTDQAIIDTSLGVSQLNHVINLFKDPEVQTGVVSKLASIKEKLASLGDANHVITDEEFKRIVDGEISPSAKNAVAQKEALFAAYTAEREIAGGRLLVSVVKQAGGALDPTNYEKQGYLNLLNSRQNELIKRLHGQMLSDEQINAIVQRLDESTSGSIPLAKPQESKIATEADIQTTMDKNHMTRKEVIDALKKKGFTIQGEK